MPRRSPRPARDAPRRAARRAGGVRQDRRTARGGPVRRSDGRARSSCGRTSAGTTPSTRSSAGPLHGGPAAARAARCCRCRGARASSSCRRPSWPASRSSPPCRRRRRSPWTSPGHRGSPSSGSSAARSMNVYSRADRDQRVVSSTRDQLEIAQQPTRVTTGRSSEDEDLAEDEDRDDEQCDDRADDREGAGRQLRDAEPDEEGECGEQKRREPPEGRIAALRRVAQATRRTAAACSGGSRSERAERGTAMKAATTRPLSTPQSPALLSSS